MTCFEGQRTLERCAILCALLFSTIACSPSSIQAGPTLELPDEEPEPVAVTVFTEKVELFMEFPRLLPGVEARFLAHVTLLDTGEPVRSGQLRLELSPPGGTPIVFLAQQPTRDGLFIPVGSLASPGSYTARILVESEQVQDEIPLQSIIVHADLAGAFAAAEAEATEDAPQLVPFLLEQQWKIGLRMEQVSARTLNQRLLVPGEVQAAQHAKAQVSAPLAGRLLAPDQGRLPRIGERVERGQLLGYLEPTLSTSDLAQHAANAMNLRTLEMEVLFREFDLEAKSLEVQQALHQSQIQLNYASQTLGRIAALRAKGLGTQAELEAAKRDMQLAERGAEGARGLQQAFALAEARLAGLRTQGSGQTPEELHARYRQPLLAPLAGEVVAAQRVEGESVGAGDLLFRLLDLERVWITTHVSEFDLGRIGAAPGALLEFAAFPDRRLDVFGALNGRLVSFGREVDPATRNLALCYEVLNPDGLLRAGMFADVYLATEQALDAVAIPAAAVVLENGRPVAFVLLHGEAFQKRELELGIRDGDYVEVKAGIQVGERVVTAGAYLVKLAAASPSSFGAGHAH